MRAKHNSVLPVAAVCILALCNVAYANDQAAALKSALDAARAAEQAALQAENLWGRTSKMIAKAEALAKEGKRTEAIALAQEAKNQGDLAVAQSQLEAERWAETVPE